MEKKWENKYISAYAQSKINKLQKDILELTMEIAELKDELSDHSCHTPTDGLEVGSPEDYDYDDCPQLNLFEDK